VFDLRKTKKILITRILHIFFTKIIFFKYISKTEKFRNTCDKNHKNKRMMSIKEKSKKILSYRFKPRIKCALSTKINLKFNEINKKLNE